MDARSRRPGFPTDAAFADPRGATQPRTSRWKSPGPAWFSAAGPERGQAQDRPSPWSACIRAGGRSDGSGRQLGLILIFVPWKRAWTDNSLVLNYPQWRAFLEMNFICGAVSGIGLLDLWVGISRAVGYRNPGKSLTIRGTGNPR